MEVRSINDCCPYFGWRASVCLSACLPDYRLMGGNNVGTTVSFTTTGVVFWKQPVDDCVVQGKMDLCPDPAGSLSSCEP